MRPFRFAIFVDAPRVPESTPQCARECIEHAWRKIRHALDVAINVEERAPERFAIDVNADDLDPAVLTRAAILERYGFAPGYEHDAGVDQLAALVDAAPEGSLWCVVMGDARPMVVPVKVIERRTVERWEVADMRGTWALTAERERREARLRAHEIFNDRAPVAKPPRRRKRGGRGRRHRNGGRHA